MIKSYENQFGEIVIPIEMSAVTTTGAALPFSLDDKSEGD
jgi:hypothetical protein